MIKTLKISNFKSIKKQSFEFRPLVILTGTNSSGKSSVLHALLLMLDNKSSHSLQELTKKFNKFNIARNNLIKKSSIDIELNSELYNINEGDENNKIHCSKELIFEENIFFISANRVGAEDLVSYNDYEKFGINAEYAFSYFDKYWQKEIQIAKFEDDKTLKGQLWKWCQEIFELNFDVQTKKINENVAEIKYYFRNIDKELSPFNVGTGISYALRILIIGLNCKKGDIFIVENPEIHLHPKAISNMAKFFIFLAKNGVQVILETHSEHIINSACYEVCKKNFDSSNIVIYYKADQNSDFEKINVGNSGKFVDENGNLRKYPSGFFDANSAELWELL
ncbi:ATPase, AAA family [Campylobacter vicugnae]|uniref:ATPase, AAA family n=1 Tax=Campylobacter vicugnae TaxID=1660076 RepID=A0A1X9T071_9BACT|nr:DUF3696 domain-containing protein [Campylobacter sp. RM8964]ARR01855.1 ATPase, AAA family [Campylobacter sp. RM8964]